MKNDHWHAAKQLLDELSELPEHERAQRITQACTGDLALRREVERLLTLERESGGYFTELGEALNRGDAMPEQIGVYRIEGEIGHGGMGTVYLGQRNDGQFEQSVAIKVVRRGVSDTMQDRFRDERRILAQLQHPGIAYLLDGGSLADGRPYFVMEHVRGETITAYADRKSLDTDARLALFCEVCAAVSHAHRNLIIHRDLKPGNVMVCEDDRGQPVVKLLDFGIARIVAEGLDEAMPDGASSDAAAPVSGMTAHAPTELGQQAFTPRYAAPEQLRGETLTTAADIYALGILLHELLTGTHPHVHDAQTPTRDGTLQDPPIAPSRRARSLSIPDAARHASTPQRLARRLRGDLDSIALKAIQHEPEQRYASAAQLADDIGHHLRGSAVNARHDTITYRMGVFARRHQRGLAVALAALLASGLFGMLHVQRIAHERDLANAETTKAKEVASLLVDMFESADPSQARGEDVTVRQVLDRASTRLDNELANQPAVKAQMKHIMGSIYVRLGVYDTATDLLQQGLEMRRKLYGPLHPDVAQSIHGLAVLAWERGKYERAETLLRDALAQYLELFGPNHLEVASVRNDLAAVLRREGKLDESESLYQQALATRRAQLGEHDPAVLTILSNMATLLSEQGHSAAAEDMYRKVLAARRESLGPIHPKVANTISSLAVLLREERRFAEAETLAREALAMDLTLYGENHSRVADAMNTLGGALRGQERYDEAETAYRKALAVRIEVFGKKNLLVADSLNNLANLYRNLDRPADAEPLYRQAIGIYREGVGAEHPWTATGMKNLGKLFLEMDNAEAAEAQFREALRIRELVYSPEHWQVAEARSLLGASLARQGRFDIAEPLLLQAHATLEQSRGAQDPRTQDAFARLLALREQRSTAR